MIYHIGRIKKKNSRARNRFIDAENKEVAGSGGEGVGGGIGEMSEIGEGYKRYKLPVINSHLNVMQPRECVFVVLVTQLCPTLCDPIDCRPPGSSVYGIL